MRFTRFNIIYIVSSKNRGIDPKKCFRILMGFGKSEISDAHK